MHTYLADTAFYALICQTVQHHKQDLFIVAKVLEHTYRKLTSHAHKINTVCVHSLDTLDYW